MNKQIKLLLAIGILLCLLLVWWPAYFVTGDGPCHLYNAQVLHDMWLNRDVAFYRHYYDVSYQPNPNWLGSALMALLLFFTKGVIAEKIFLSCYILLFITGGYLLLSKISRGNSLWPLVILLFPIQYTLLKGFYNFSFSIAFYCWMVWSWIQFLENRSLKKGLLFFTFVALTFFTHLLAFSIGAFTCAALAASYAFSDLSSTGKQRFTGFMKYVGWLTLALLPFLLLMKQFTEANGGMQLQLTHHFYRLIELMQFKYLVSITRQEAFLAEVAGVLLLLLLSICFLPFKNFRIHKYDGFAITLVAVLAVYLFTPESFLGHLILISMRTQLFLFLLATCCIAYRWPDEWPSKLTWWLIAGGFAVLIAARATILFQVSPEHNSTALFHAIWVSVRAPLSVFAAIWLLRKQSTGQLRETVAYLLLGCFLLLTIVRLMKMNSAGKAAADYVSAGKLIRPYAVVLPLDLSPSGIDEQGNVIADENYLFTHAAQYIGTEKPLIFLDNYEANMGYFPLRWNDRKSPYLYLSTGAGIEGQPPGADIASYKENTGVTIDYILIWGNNPSMLSNAPGNLYSTLMAQYHPVYTSGSGRTVLYEKN